MGFTCSIFKAANVESAPSRLPEWAEHAVGSAQSFPPEPKNQRPHGDLQAEGRERRAAHQMIGGQPWILPTGPCTFTLKYFNRSLE